VTARQDRRRPRLYSSRIRDGMAVNWRADI
jgi:hypothetical protein